MYAERSLRAPLRGLLVLAALLGVLGMHGLTSPGGVSPPVALVASHPGPGHSGESPAHPGPAHQAPGHSGEHAAAGHACPPAEHGGGDEHDAHAGGMCLAGALAAPFNPPPLAAGLPAVPADLPVAVGAAAFDPSTAGRAPPSLADLQLLRI
ncbi:DUF6153 family protein [Kitasatospora sp. NPDC054939]